MTKNILHQKGIYFLSLDLKQLTDYIEEKKPTQIAVIVDSNTDSNCYHIIKKIIPFHQKIVINPGEEFKNLNTCSHIWQEMTDAEFDRKALIINLGGGVIGDMGGFCAATYKRGIDFIQIPTTLLSMVDASVGGKLGIDFNGFKNHIGVFDLPKRVLILPDFLKTLSPMEVRSGFAEVIKHCLIQDKAMWLEIQKISQADILGGKIDWQPVINHSILIKANVTDIDPTEKGLRKILNFGHTIGHAIETYCLGIVGRKLLHGEAIAIGMITESYLSFKLGNISQDDLNQICQYLISIYSKVAFSQSDIDQILPLALQDKKNVGGAIKMALLNSIGDCGYDFEISKKEMEQAINFYLGL